MSKLIFKSGFRLDTIPWVGSCDLQVWLPTAITLMTLVPIILHQKRGVRVCVRTHLLDEHLRGSEGVCGLVVYAQSASACVLRYEGVSDTQAL
jgi:hypothetical protein